MAIIKALLVATSVACVLSYPQHGHQHHEPEHHHYPKYEFKYAVKDTHTGDIKEHHESRDGDKVEGHYSLVEPDGTRRVVHYTADHKTGFNAVVTREGHAAHPAPVAHKDVAHVPVPLHSHLAHHYHSFNQQ